VTAACSDMWDLRALRVSRPASKLYIQHRYPKAVGLDILDLDILNATILHIRLWDRQKPLDFMLDLCSTKVMRLETRHWKGKANSSAIFRSSAEPQKHRATAT
jgi:hypothetical protein